MTVDELERALGEERERPSVDFARRLDEWAEAGFPRDAGLGPRLDARAGSLRRAWDRLISTPPRRILLPAGAVATVVVVAGVAIGRGGEDSTTVSPSGPVTQQAESGANDAGGRGSNELSIPDAGVEAAPPAATSPPSAGDTDIYPVPPSPGPNGIAPGVDQRLVDATARLTLGAPADEVQRVANEVVGVADRYDGVVLDSEVTRDQAGARATFQLEIPTKRLDAALGDLSGIADVISRTQGSTDITAQAVRARRHLAGTLDRIRRARIDLIRADTREQRLVLRSQIQALQARADAYETQLAGVKRQARFATVAVDVTSSGDSGGDGNWGLDNAADDAASTLETIGGIALVSLAILAPLALVAAITALAIAAIRRHRRNRALDA